MEYLDIVDDLGNPTGKIVERKEAHEKGILHRTSHVWFVRKRESIEILLQKRSMNKDSWPGCYDISTAGHIPAGIDFISSAIRECKEELGIDLKKEDLLYCGYRKIQYEHMFHSKKFIDNQYSNIYMVMKDIDDFTLQKEEVEDVIWMDFEQCKQGVLAHTFPNCIVYEELMILEKAFEKYEINVKK